MHVIGEERSERLDVIPAQHRVLVTRRPKYGCRACAGAVVQAPAPERLIRSGLPTETLVAHVLVSKYAWHLPLYRQAQILLSQGIEIDRSGAIGVLGWLCRGFRADAAVAAPARDTARLAAAVCRRDPRTGKARSAAGRTKTGYFWS